MNRSMVRRRPTVTDAILCAVAAAVVGAVFKVPDWLAFAVGLLGLLALEFLAGPPLRLRGMTQPEGVRDFTLPIEPIRFKVDNDEFVAPGIISPVVLKRVGDIYTRLAPALEGGALDNIDAVLDGMAQLFRTLLPGPHGERFATRLLSDEEPIDLQRQALPILYYLMERWGLRPTQPSSPSSDGSASPDGPSVDISSTAGVSPSGGDSPT